LANVLFMPSGGTMVKIRRHESGPGNVGYWHLADALGQRYLYVNGVPDSEQPLVGRGCNLYVSPDSLDQRLEGLV
jgi:hypothetical protein